MVLFIDGKPASPIDMILIIGDYSQYSYDYSMNIYQHAATFYRFSQYNGENEGYMHLKIGTTLSGGIHDSMTSHS
jgi:hypothetical protein